jgi:hypothetical protein
MISLWQLANYQADNSFADGICAAIVRRERPPEERAMRLFHWVSRYDEPVSARQAAAAPAAFQSVTAADSMTPPRGLLTPRSMVEHRAYYRGNCGFKAWLLAVLARRSGLKARELRLCSADHVARHVVCEIRIDAAWRVFDPTLDLDFRRADGELATAADLRDPLLLAANTRRAPAYDLHRWQFTHPERLHFEKVPLIGALLRRLAARLTGRPAEELAMPFAMEQPRLVVAALFAALALFALAVAGLLARRLRTAADPLQHNRLPRRSLALEPAEQD